ncbi:hypothetical protein BIY23_00890 [Wolbachia pipientis]|uniref:Methionyl-tRNA formyltransferase n=1 Tax=Wolbachia pipientis TaxID=955 RepID=A0A1E7QKM4_WOLPI|nr:hypothetical protein BIY23_00890 [Wolbachia pipientis]
MRIIFMGSPEFAVRPLKLLLASFHEVVAVYTKAPKPAKRGKQLMETPIHSIDIIILKINFYMII